jgi:hypothetical protein
VISPRGRTSESCSHKFGCRFSCSCMQEECSSVFRRSVRKLVSCYWVYQPALSGVNTTANK